MKGMTVGIVAGALTLVLAWLLKAFAQVEIPTEVSTSIGIIIQAVVHQYFPESDIPPIPTEKPL